MKQSSNKARVLQYLEERAHDVHWAIIAGDLGINRGSTRSILTRLCKSGQITRTMRGFYCNKSNAGLALPRIHSIQLKYHATDLHFGPAEETLGPVVIKLGRDRRRKTISGFLGHKGLGMDLDLFRVALLSWRLLVEKHYGRLPELEEIQVTNMQLNMDLQGVRIEGIQAVTVTSVLGVMERYYNKRDRIRAEVQATPKRIQDIEHLLRGGVTSYNLVQTNYMLVQELRKIEQQQAEILKLNGSIYRLMAGILQK